MIKKTEHCLYCGEKMQSKTAKKKFCCPIHRVYWNREKALIGIAKNATENSKQSEGFKKEVYKAGKGNIKVFTSDKHPLWQEGDPKEGSIAFYKKYEASTYDELQKKQKNEE